MGSAAAPGTREAELGDLEWVGAVMARAFQGDPASRYVIPDDEKRASKSPRLFRAQARVVMDKGVVLVDVERRGAAFWCAPGRWRDRPKHVVRFVPSLVTIGRDLVRAMRIMRVLEASHPDQAHWYLDALGTDPAHQGHGVGSALMAPILDRCDAENVGAHLVASKPENVPYYRRHHFEVTADLAVPGGPTLYAMWRAPQR